MANLKGQKPATNSRPGSHSNLLTAFRICTIATYYYIILHNFMAITSEILQNNCELLHITTQTLPSITIYYYIEYYFVLLPNFFHISLILLPITTNQNPPLLHITTRYITSYYFEITSILLSYYFLLLHAEDYFVLLPSALLHITFCFCVQPRMQHYYVLLQYAITS